MSATLDRIRALVATGDVRISEHGYDELTADGLTAREIIAGVANAEPIEDYPNFPKGSSVLALQRDAAGRIIHVVWGIPRRYTNPAVLVTAYRPDPGKWDATFRQRRP